MTSEKSLHKQVVVFFTRILPLTITWYHPRANAMSRREGGIWKSMGVIKGLPDFCIHYGDRKTLWLELKSAKGRLSPAQFEMRGRLESLGHAYAVCRSLDEVEAALRYYSVPMIGRIAA